jgi:hypothetical protein
MDKREFFEGLAEVYEAGAKCARGWCFNIDRQQDAEILEAQASKAREIAAREEPF